MTSNETILTDMSQMSTIGFALTTSQPAAYVQVLKQVNKYVVNIILTVIMAAMGCAVTVEDFRVVLRRPVGAVIGLGCQFILMPVAAFTLAHVMGLKPAFALGMLIVGSSPGGTLSTIQTHYSRGDVCLSIVMTTTSTIAAVGLLPFNLWLYSRSWTESTQIHIPYKNIIIALILILIPVGVGMVIRWKSTKIARVITQIGSVSGIVLIGVNTIISLIINPGLFSTPWTLWVAGLLLPSLGYSLGYLIALLLRQNWKQRRTISFETGTQNVGLALALVVVTFGDSPLFFDLFSYPTVFAITTIIDSFSLIGLYLFYDKWYLKRKDDEEKGDKLDGDGNGDSCADGPVSTQPMLDKL